MNKRTEQLVGKIKDLLKTASGKEPSDAVQAKLEEEYVKVRDELLEITELSEYIPAVLNNTVSLYGFRLKMSDYGSYSNRRVVIDEEFKEIEDKLESWDIKTVVPEGFELSQDQITKKIREHFGEKNSKLKNIYGEFTQIQKQLGCGGTSIVKAFELEDVAGEKSNYAFKFLAENISDNKEGRAYKRFKQAHLNISCIQHTGAILPQVHIDTLKVAEDLVIPYVMMPVADMTLKKYVIDLKKSGELTFVKLGEILDELCGRIETIHKKGIIHRDIKPENIFIHDGNIVLGDFDIAKFSDDAAKLIETKDGERLANFNCSAPEQSSKAFDEITAAADWYALGQVWHWMITADYKRGNSPIDYRSYGDEFVKYEKAVSILLSDNPSERPDSYEKIIDLFEKKALSKWDSLFNLDKFVTMATVGVDYSQHPFYEITDSNKINVIIKELVTQGEDYQLNFFKGSSDSSIIKFSQTKEGSSILRAWTTNSHALEFNIEKIIVYTSPLGTGGHVFSIITGTLNTFTKHKNECPDNYEYYKEYKGLKLKEQDIKDGYGNIEGETIELDGTQVGIERWIKPTIIFFATQHGFAVHTNFSILEDAYNYYNPEINAKLNFAQRFQQLRRPDWVRSAD